MAGRGAVSAPLRLSDDGRGMLYVRVPSSLAWMVREGVIAALERIEKAQKDGPDFLADKVDGLTVVVLLRDR